LPFAQNAMAVDLPHAWFTPSWLFARVPLLFASEDGMSVIPVVARPRLTDSELLQTEFRYYDPENSISRLNRGVPDPDAHPVIIGYYDETPPGGRLAQPPKPFVRCCHCGKRRHWIGHVIRDDKDQVYIIGSSNCGRDHYGVRYEAAERVFRAESQRRATLKRWSNMLSLAPGFERDVQILLGSLVLADRERKRAELKRASPVGFAKLVKAAELAEALHEVEEVRDYAAEQQQRERYERALAAYRALPPLQRRRLRDEGREPELDDRPIYRRISTPLGHLVGTGFLSENDPRQAALALRTTLRAVQQIAINGTDSVNPSELNRLLREMTDRPNDLRATLISAGFDVIFFEDNNLVRLERWSSFQARFTYTKEGNAIRVWDASLGNSLVQPIKDEDLPECPAIFAAEYLDDEFKSIMVEAA
jgi:hypothetical protein